MTDRLGPLVTIIIPTYNYGAYISAAIESALTQSYRHIEILVVDDGSVDDTAEIVKRYADRLSYLYKPNGGISSARNLGIREAAGEYIVFLDSDDTLSPGYVETSLNHLAMEAPYVGYVYSQVRYFEASTGASRYPPFGLDALRRENVIPASCVIRSSVAKSYEYDERLHVLEDWDYYLTLAENRIFGALIDEPIFNYRIHVDNKSALNKSKLRMVLDVRREVVRKHSDFYGPLRLAMFEIRYWGLKWLSRFRSLTLRGIDAERGLDPLG